jgi:hypothetical protein
MDTLIELDNRRRAGLRTVARPEHSRYLASVADDGTITLTPAVVVSEMELRLRANPVLMERILHSLAHPEEAVEIDWRGDGSVGG